MIYFIENFRNQQNLHVACQNLSQIDITKKLHPFEAVILFTPKILNTVLYRLQKKLSNLLSGLEPLSASTKPGVWPLPNVA